MDKKLIYILPETTETTHMKYNVQFIECLAKENGLDIFLIIERGQIKENLKDKLGVKTLKYSGSSLTIVRIIKLIYFLISARLKGYSKAYVHYSFVGALVASCIPGLKVFYWNCGMPFSYQRPKFTNWYQKLTYRRINHFVTGTKGLAVQYADHYDFPVNKSIIIPNWIDLNSWQERINKIDKTEVRKHYQLDDNKIVFANQRLSERKGAHYLANIAAGLEPNSILLISNDGPYKERLVEELKAKNISHKTRLIGRLDQDELLKIFAISDIFILPSDEEGMSHSLLEAMASKTACLAFDVGSNKEMLEGVTSECVAQAGDIDTFKNLLTDFLNDDQRAAQVGQKLFEHVKGYDKKVAQELFQKYVTIK
jgi:glycosyltransferase involved in cell wall biosynthesis